MKKATILIIGILSMLVISGAAALRTNIIIQSPSEPSRLISFEDFEDTPSIVIETSEIDLVDTTIQLPSDIFTDFIVGPAPLISTGPAPLPPIFMNCTVNFTVIPPGYSLSQNGLNYICENFGDINLCCVRTGLSWYFTLEGTDYPETGGTAQIVARLASGLIDSLTMTSPERGTFTQVDLNTANSGPVTLEDARLIAEHDDTSADQWCYGG